MRWRVVVVVAVLTFAASCGSSEPATTERPAGAIDLRDASATELVAQLSSALHMPVTVDTGAVPLTRCARVTLVAPAGTPSTRVVALAREVLRGAALSLEEREGHFVVARIEDLDPPPGCPGVRRARSPEGALDPAAPAPLPDPFASTLEPGAPVEGVREISEHTYEVDPDAPLFASGVEGWMQSARVIPHQEEGQVVGLRLYGIRRSSMLGALGFQNGDTVTSLNGRPLTAPESALEAYSELRAADRIVVELTRRGAPLTLTYVRRAAARTP